MGLRCGFAGVLVRLVLREGFWFCSAWGLLDGKQRWSPGQAAGPAGNHAGFGPKGRTDFANLRFWPLARLVSGCGFGEFPAGPARSSGSIRWWR